MKRAKKTALAGLKIAAASATILGVAWAVATFGDSGGVQEAQADILSLDFGPKTNQQKFVDSLKILGMEKPRAYDWNGNKMFFSTTTTAESPTQVLNRFQTQFVKSGLNDKAHTSVPPLFTPSMIPTKADIQAMSTSEREQLLARLKHNLGRDNDMLGGGIVPVTVTKDYVAMAGGQSRGEADDGFEFAEELAKAKDKRLANAFKSVRYIEAWRERGHTRISAMWNDEQDFQYDRFNDGKSGAELPMNASIPACDGCKRIMRFKGETEDGYVSNVFEGSLQVDNAVEYYRRAMPMRGWKESPTSQVMRELERMGVKPPTSAKLISFSRGTQFVTMIAFPNSEGRTTIHLLESP